MTKHPLTPQQVFQQGYDEHHLNTPVELSKTRKLIQMAKSNHARRDEAFTEIIDRLARGNNNNATLHMFRDLLTEIMHASMASPADAPAPQH